MRDWKGGREKRKREYEMKKKQNGRKAKKTEGPAEAKIKKHLREREESVQEEKATEFECEKKKKKKKKKNTTLGLYDADKSTCMHIFQTQSSPHFSIWDVEMEDSDDTTDGGVMPLCGRISALRKNNRCASVFDCVSACLSNLSNNATPVSQHRTHLTLCILKHDSARCPVCHQTLLRQMSRVLLGTAVE